MPILTDTNTGIHNANLELARGRILRGGSWKKQRIIVIIPAADMIPAQVALSHWNLMFPPNQAVFRMLALGMEVGEAYSQAIEQILAHPELSQWEYILTLEHDNLPPPDGVVKLLEGMEQHPQFDCLGACYFTKGEGGVGQLWGDPSDPAGANFRPQPPVPGKIVPVFGTGMGFNIWRLAMFKDARLRRPWFKTLTGIEGQGIATQDCYFWSDARRHGYQCAVHCGVLVGHMDSNGVVW